MSWTAVLLVAVAVSVDGLWGGLAFGLRRVRIGPGALFVISLISGGCAGLAMVAGQILARTVPLAAAKWVSAALFLGIGITLIYEAWLERVLVNPVWADADYSGDLRGWEALVMGLAVAIDASAAAFTIGLAGYGSAAVPLLIGAAHFLLVGLGNLMGSRRLVHLLTSRFAYLPGGVLVVLGLLRFR